MLRLGIELLLESVHLPPVVHIDEADGPDIVLVLFGRRITPRT